MEKGITKPSILVVADDFTGANDAGVSLAQVGHTVDVAFATPYHGDASVWVINS
ncbi:four-carbon acid sugar kinase family protein, partial [Escherichia coli]